MNTDKLLATIEITDDELKTGALHGHHLRLGALLLHSRGYVLLRNAISPEVIGEMREAFQGIYGDCLDSVEGSTGWPWTSRRTGTVFWERSARLRIFPKLRGPFGKAEITANPFAMQILEEILGEGFYCKSVSSDTCIRGSILQAPHRDIQFYDDDEPYGYIVNVPMVDCGLHNGPLEIWPGGSHLWRGRLFVRYGMEPNVMDARNPLVEEFAEHLPSVKLELSPGDLLIRDPGMWHRGTPNPTDEPRTMLTISYFRKNFFYNYGDPRYNVDRSIFLELEPAAQRLFSYYFDFRDRQFWRHRMHEAFTATEQRPILGAPLRAAVRLAWTIRSSRLLNNSGK